MALRPEDVLVPFRTPRARDFYLAYLNSPAWRRTRTRALQDAHYRCHQCGARRDLQVHHRTYERLGAESPEDLEVLCANCHEGAHVRQMAHPPDGIYLKLARQAVRQDYTASIADLAEDVKTLCARFKIPYDSGRLTRALELVTGSAVTRRVSPVRWIGAPHEPRQLTSQEAHEIVCRLDIVALVDRLAKPMPAVEKTPADQQAHEARLRTQVQAEHRRAYRAERQRVPILEKLDRIFTGEGL